MRTSFNHDFELAAAVLRVQDCADISPRECQEVVSLLNQYGFVVLNYQRVDDQRRQLLGLRTVFGEIKRHRRSDTDGVAPISPSSKFPGYYGTSSGPHPPHTDGAFDRVPPRFAALQCVVAAVEGGHTQLVSGVGLYDAIGRENRAALKALFDPDALTVCRDDQAAQSAVFSMSDNLVQMRFRDDTTASFAARWDVAAGVELFRRHLADPQNVVEFRLEPQHILIVDNRGVLHGRTAFDPSGGRLLLRATFDGDPRGTFGLRCGFSASVPE